MSVRACLVLRLAAPLQSWGLQSEFNRRETAGEPTYSGILGLLAAAQGRRREDPIMDLLELKLGVRTDRPGAVLRDYHTVSELDGTPMRSTQVNRRGQQKRTSPAKYTAVTERFYLQDAVFVAVVEGRRDLLQGLAHALRHPTFPLALGRRACPPTQPLLLRASGEPDDLWSGSAKDVLTRVPWQEPPWRREGYKAAVVSLSVTIDDDHGEERRLDVPTTFAHKDRTFTARRVSRLFVDVPTGLEGADGASADDGQSNHDPFALLGW